MDGTGIFKNNEGFTLKGSFKSNLFVDDSVLRNPFMNEKDYTLFKKQRKETLKQQERNEKIKHSYLEKI